MAQVSYILKDVGYNNTNDALVKNTQKKLKQYDNNGLPTSMLKSVIKAVINGEHVMETVCNDVNSWIKAHEQDLIEVSCGMSKIVSDFILQAKEEEDFVKCFVFRDGKINIWLIIDEADYESSVKYIRLARKIMDTQYINIDLMIYSKDEIDEIEQEINDLNVKYKVE